MHSERSEGSAQRDLLNILSAYGAPCRARQDLVAYGRRRLIMQAVSVFDWAKCSLARKIDKHFFDNIFRQTFFKAYPGKYSTCSFGFRTFEATQVLESPTG